VNGVGAFITGIVLLVVVLTKAHEGAWIIMVLIPILVIFFRVTRTHYNAVASQLSLNSWQPEERHHNAVVVPVSGVQRPDDYITVVLPEFVPARWWHHLFHNQRALLIKGALLFKPNTVVTSVPFHLTR
jgi:hypothetical protein